MKKIIIGSLMTTASPFTILIGSAIFRKIGINFSEAAMWFACIIGGITVCMNWIMGLMFIIQGHEDLKTFSNKTKDIVNNSI